MLIYYFFPPVKGNKERISGRLRPGSVIYEFYVQLPKTMVKDIHKGRFLVG